MIEGQMDMFDMLPVKRGDIIEDSSLLGRELTWAEAEASVGQLIWVEHRGETYLYWKAMEPIEAVDDYYYRTVDGEYVKTPSRRLIFKDKGFCAIDSYWEDYKFYAMN